MSISIIIINHLEWLKELLSKAETAELKEESNDKDISYAKMMATIAENNHLEIIKEFLNKTKAK